MGEEFPVGLAFALMGVFVVVLAFAILLYSRIARQMGYSGWASLLFLFPFIDLLVLLYLAFSRWPVVEKVERLRREAQSLRDQKFALQDRLAEANGKADGL